MRIIPSAKYWSAHTHSVYSVNDALPQVRDIVAQAHAFGQKGLGLTDHGNMAGSVELYTECMKVGIKPFPGSELYFVPDLEQYKRDYRDKHKKAQRYHMGVLAYTTQGYENLVRLSTASHENFFHKPTVDWAVLSSLNLEGIAVTTGCHFGYLVQQLMEKGPAYAKRYLYQLQAFFGDAVYVELQNHNIEHEGSEWTDDLVSQELLGLAEDLGLPCVLTQDSHYVEPRDRHDHEALKRLVSFGPDPDDAVFPGDGFHMVNDQWMRDHHEELRYQRGVEGLGDLLDRHDLHISVLDSYSYSIPQVVADPQIVMWERCAKALNDNDLGKQHYDKAVEEMETIGAAGMEGYMVLVAMVTDWMRNNGVLFQTRGSAAGSVVSWLMGISSIDPLKWDLRFERFISKDRTKPPDIDLDMAHDRRQELIDWLNTKFVAHQIGTWAKYSIDKEDDEKGSLLIRYFSTIKKRGNEDVQTYSDIPSEDIEMLERLSKRKLYKGMGTNAAGVVLTSTREEFDRLVPMAWMVRGGGGSGLVTQYGKDEVEALGLVKLDVLGSKTLTVMERAMSNLGLEPAQLNDIQYGDKPTFSMMRRGDTDGIFQLEGSSTRWGMKDLQPSKIKDVIDAMALFRPAAMKTGGTKAFIARKHGREKTPKRHPLLAKALDPTYGVMLYQEQVIDMLRGLGMDAENLTKFLKAVKASNKDIGDAAVVIAGYKEWIDEQCTRIGMSVEDQVFLDESIAGFAEYGFNRAHASVYGITAYRCAYLAARHPLEFHAALLAVAAGTDKEDVYLRATRRRGIKILRADINRSSATYSVDGHAGAIRKGLLAIEGVGLKSAEVLAANQPYTSLEDLIERTPRRPISGGNDYDGTRESLTGVLRHLEEQGVLKDLPDRV